MLFINIINFVLQPIENYNEWRLLYFISFLLLVGFFVLNMFVGVVVENFHKCRESQEMEERAVRAAKRQQKLERKRKSEDPKNLSGSYCPTESGDHINKADFTQFHHHFMMRLNAACTQLVFSYVNISSITQFQFITNSQLIPDTLLAIPYPSFS